jgi:hypothetical protein
MRTLYHCFIALVGTTLLISFSSAPGQTFTPSVEQASATWPIGTNYGGFVSTADDPLGLFLGESVHFRGLETGGDELVYRFRIDFDSDVILHRIVVEGAAWAGGGSWPIDIIRLFDASGQPISEVDALAGSASFQSVEVPGEDTPGRTFFIEEVNGDDVWRYRSGIQVYASERPVEVWVDDDWDGCSSGAMLDGHTCGLDAFYSIQTALNSVASPGKVNVAPGFYSENINFNGKEVLLASEQGAGLTVLSGAGGSVVTFESGETPTSTIKGFTIQGGSGEFGGGIAIWFCSPTIESNIIRENSVGHGGGIFVNNGSPHITGNLIESNEGAYGAAISMVNTSSPLIENNIIVNNGPGEGISAGLPEDAAPVIVNNVIAGNSGGGIFASYFPSLTIKNNIITNNSRWGGIYTDIGSNVSLTVLNNDVWNNSPSNYGGGLEDLTGLDGNISADPGFVDTVAGDYHITKLSPAIDSGTNIGAPRSDFDGNARPVDATGDGVAWTDMGAYELVGPFDDVPPHYWAVTFIEKFATAGITGGCGDDLYCPSLPVTRAQMAVFLERGIHGSDFVPPPATGIVFLDIAVDDFAASFVEQLFADGITGGCGSGNYCPSNAVTRAQMAVFLLKAKHGAGYQPPVPSGAIFGDVDLSYWAVSWIEQLAAEGITGGCGESDFCPERSVTRAEMAVFMVRTFGL